MAVSEDVCSGVTNFLSASEMRTRSISLNNIIKAPDQQLAPEADTPNENDQFYDRITAALNYTKKKIIINFQMDDSNA